MAGNSLVVRHRFVVHQGPFGKIRSGNHNSSRPLAVRRARHVVREWGLAALGDSTELAVSELMTNAVQVSHAMSQAAPVRLWLLSDGAQLVILVWDASLQPPVRLDVGDAAEDGRGLLLVDAVSTDWGWQFPPDMGGKTVWALLG